MSFTLEEFLTFLKLEEYLQNFQNNDISDLNVINDYLLKRIGIDKIGHRRRILTGLEDLLGNVIDNLDNSLLQIGEGKIDDFNGKSDADNEFDTPPPLPPKLKTLIPAPQKTNASQKPVKPPRRMPLQTLNSHNSKSRSLILDNKAKPRVQPPIPPRFDLVEQTKQGGITAVVSPNHNSDFPMVNSFEQNISVGDQTKTYSDMESNLNVSGTSNFPIGAIVGHYKDVEVDYSEDEMSGDDLECAVEDEDGIPLESKCVSMMKDKDEFNTITRETDEEQVKCGRRANPNHRKSRFFQNKSGYLLKRGGVKGDKHVQKRWIEFNGTDIKYFKEKGGIPKQTIPVSRMKDVLWEKDAKKPTFHLLTTNRKFTFIEPGGNLDDLTIWIIILKEAMMAAESDEIDENQEGGSMSSPCKEGWLLKEGHNILHDLKRRYVAIKDDKLCYYYSHQDFQDDLPINDLEMKLVSLKVEDDKLRLNLVTHVNKSYIFQAEDLESYNSWKEAIQTSIQYGIGDDTYRNKIYENPSNMKCADCGDNNPIYASINLLVVVCAKCIGFHRQMGADVSKSRSLLMDKNVWTPSLIKLLQTVGNDKANSLWNYNLPADDMINPKSTEEEREEFIKDKYKEKKYFNWSPLFGEPEKIGLELQKVVQTNNALETLRLIISKVDIYYVSCGSEEQSTPYEIARNAGMDLQMELLTQFNGHLTKEERMELEEYKKSVSASLQSQHEKSGSLLVRTTRSDTFKEKQVTLIGKKVELKKMERGEETETIDLTKIEGLEMDKEEQRTLLLKVPGKTYFMKAYHAEDAQSWYEVLHNKQVIAVPIEKQDCTDKKIPFLISECIAFMEQHALLTEGIYRHSGVKSTIEKLALMFNRDAANIRLDIEDFPDVHAVAGLIKFYLRQLPEPLLTKDLYMKFISNACDRYTEEEENEKLEEYKALLKQLPKINYFTLRFIILHLKQVISLSASNKMAQQNIIVIFGPIILSSAETTDQAWLKREYAVLSDLLNDYIVFFDVTDGENKMLKGMIDFLHQQEQQPTIAEFTMVTIFVKDEKGLLIEDQMKMTYATKPGDVCLFCIKKHDLSVNRNLGLFEITVCDSLERLVHSAELVLKLAETIGVKSKLVVQDNYVTDLINTHKATSLCVEGCLHYNKSDKWKKNFYVELKTGNIRVYSKKGNTKEEENIPIHETELFIGFPKKKTIASYGFALFKNREREFRYFCSDDEMEVNKFIATMLFLRYPSGVWTPISGNKANDQVSTEHTQDSSYWGRQSTYVFPHGTGNRLLEQLQKRRDTLRSIFTR